MTVEIKKRKISDTPSNSDIININMQGQVSAIPQPRAPAPFFKVSLMRIKNEV
jgi:hypothetical protein